MSRMELIVGSERRRNWTDEQKAAIVAEAFAPGARVIDAARRAEVNTGQIYRWRDSMRAAANGFAEMVVTPDAQPAPGGVIEVEFARGVRARIGAGVGADLARAVIEALVRR